MPLIQVKFDESAPKKRDHSNISVRNRVRERGGGRERERERERKGERGRAKEYPLFTLSRQISQIFGFFFVAIFALAQFPFPCDQPLSPLVMSNGF